MTNLKQQIDELEYELDRFRHERPRLQNAYTANKNKLASLDFEVKKMEIDL